MYHIYIKNSNGFLTQVKYSIKDFRQDLIDLDLDLQKTYFNRLVDDVELIKVDNTTINKMIKNFINKKTIDYNNSVRIIKELKSKELKNIDRIY